MATFTLVLEIEDSCKQINRNFSLVKIQTNEKQTNKKKIKRGPLYDPQSTTNVFGKVLRIDVNKRSNSTLYSIPDSNPFVNRTSNSTNGNITTGPTSPPILNVPGDTAAIPNATTGLPEIFVWGLENPYRIWFDRKGLLWIADDGVEYEELDNAWMPGLNFG